jgi:hypothetical protein
MTKLAIAVALPSLGTVKTRPSSLPYLTRRPVRPQIKTIMYLSVVGGAMRSISGE